jgi:hypothetical protein
MMTVQPKTLLVRTIKTRSLLFSRRVEARPSRLFEARVVVRNMWRSRGETAGISARRRRDAEENSRKLGPVGAERQSHLPADRYVRADPVAAGLGRHPLIDAVRSYAQASSLRPLCRRPSALLPPLPSVHLKASNWERERHLERAARVKAVLHAAALLVMPSEPTSVQVGQGGERFVAQRARHYVQPINYLAYRSGTERLRITPRPYCE